MRDSHAIKSALIVLLVVFAAAILHSHATGSLYPAAHVGLFASALVCAGLSFQTHSRHGIAVTLGMIVVVATAYRLHLYGYPGTYHSIDTEWFLANAQTLTDTGSVDRLPAGFYRSAPAYPIALSIIQQVTGSGLFITQAAVPLFMGIGTPLLAWLFVGCLRPGDYRARRLAATIAAIATYGVFHSWLPIAQSLTVLPFLLCLWLLAAADRGLSHAQVVLSLVPLLAILVFSHKIPAVLLAIILVALVVVSSTRITKAPNRYALVALLAVTLLFIQMTIVTDYILGVVGTAAGVFSLGGGGGAPLEQAAATATSTGALSTVLRGANLLGILSVGGLAWIYGASQWYQSRETGWAVLTIAIAICTAFALAFIPSGIPTRGLIMIEPALAALIAVALLAVYRSSRPTAQYLVGGVVVVLLATQAFAVIGMPDGPGQPTRYPAENELEGKQFVHDHARSQPHMVSRYATQMTTPAQPETRYGPPHLDRALLAGSVNPDEHPTILYRERDIYHTTEGWYRLRWTPTEQYDRVYHQPYDGGSVSYYMAPEQEGERD